MSSSAKEDQERRHTPGNIEEPDVMTIEFLRARLLSERAVSKSARQRADELAKRVSELEDQLKFVSLQRKKAEKATSDILKILENNGITGVSEDCYSHSDEEETPGDFNSSSKGSVIHNGGESESPPKGAVVINESEMNSCSEVDSCPSTGRSLSWKSGKDPQLSLEKKKSMEFVRRRAGFGSYGSSSCRRTGKSCRRIKHRSVEELQNESEREASSKDASTCSGDDNKRLSIENGNNEEYQDEREEENMESALERQARLIGRYEEEENAQREWEEKYKKNNSGTQDSCDQHGNRSDVTEERYSTHSSTKDPSKDAQAIENPDPNDGNKATAKGESSASEFSFPTSEERNQLGEFGNNNRRHRSLPTDASSNGYGGERNTSQQNLPMVPRGASNDLGSVMDALRRAKLSLNHQMNRSAKPEYGRAGHPVSSGGLFRLPDEYLLLETSRTDRPGMGFSSTTSSFEPGKNGDHRRNLFLSDPFAYGSFERSSPSFPTSQPMNLPGIRTEQSNYLNSSYTSPIHPSVRGLYPFLPANAAALGSSPFNGEASSSKSRPNTYP